LETTTTPAEPAAIPQLAKSLRARHIAMISIGGIIGAGLFVNSINADRQHRPGGDPL